MNEVPLTKEQRVFASKMMALLNVKPLGKRERLQFHCMPDLMLLLAIGLYCVEHCLNILWLGMVESSTSGEDVSAAWS